MLLFDVIWRLTDLHVMYSDAGLMPADQMRRLYANSWRWSLHWWDGSIQFQLALFALSAVLAAALTAGYHTRLATIGCWIMWASLHTRAPFVINAGDSLIRTLVLWSMFLPLGQVWSIDAWRRGRSAAQRPQRIASVGTFAILLQVCLVYWLTAIYKLLTHNWRTGGGLQNALDWGGYNKPLGILLTDHPTLSQILSYGTIAIELIGPVVVLLAWRRPLLRIMGIATFVAFHAGIELCMYVGLFSYVSIAAWLLFVPAAFWDRVFSGSKRGATEASDRQRTVARSRAAVWLNRTSGTLCFALLFVMVSYNVLGLAVTIRTKTDRQMTHDQRMRKIPRPLRQVAQVTLLGQYWSMFARPLTTSSWFIAKARLHSGDTVDLLRDGRPFNFERPQRLALLYPNHRWRKFVLALTHKIDHRKAFSQNLCDYLFQEWNGRHERAEQIAVLELMCIYERVGGNDENEHFVSKVYARTENEDDAIEDTIDFAVPFELQEN
ncbi:MAG: HTTM domain-containing protein [Pirellulales bacterium]